MQSIEFKVGQSSIKIDQSGVTIKGAMVKLEGEMLVESKSGLMHTVEGSAMLKLNGGGVMIG
jgi:type VI secretion system secreted protein VgrG